MTKLITDLLAYFKAVFVGTWQTVFTLFDILGIIIFFYPKLAERFVNNLSLARTVGGLMFFSSFLMANFFLYRKLAKDVSYQADIHLAILKKDFSHSYGSRRSPFREVQTNPCGFNKQGMPDWGSLWANIRIANVGYEQGQLTWEYNESKTKFPSLFASDKVSIEFCPPLSIAGRSSSSAYFFFDILFTEQDPRAFAQALGALVKSKQRYEVILRYRTSRIDGESKAQELRIEGDFQGFYQKVLKYWDERGFKDLVRLAQIA